MTETGICISTLTFHCSCNFILLLKAVCTKLRIQSTLLSCRKMKPKNIPSVLSITLFQRFSNQMHICVYIYLNSWHIQDFFTTSAAFIRHYFLPSLHWRSISGDYMNAFPWLTVHSPIASTSGFTQAKWNPCTATAMSTWLLPLLNLQGECETAVISAGGSCLTATIQMQINIPSHFGENMLN